MLDWLLGKSTLRGGVAEERGDVGDQFNGEKLFGLFGDLMRIG